MDNELQYEIHEFYNSYYFLKSNTLLIYSNVFY